MPQVMVPLVVSELKLTILCSCLTIIAFPFIAGTEMQLCGKPLLIYLTTSP